MYSTYILVHVLLHMLKQNTDLEVYFCTENLKTQVYTQADFTLSAWKF
jgi:pyruvate formate-lyase activating enzyme-like uncharacterized protein